MEKIRVYQLLSRYAQNTITSAEWDELKVLVDNTDDNELWEVLHSLWEKNTYSPDDVSREDELSKIYVNIKSKTRSVPVNNRFRRMLKVAGIVLIMLSMGIGGYFYKDREYRMNFGEKDFIVDVAAGQRIMVTLPDSSAVYLNSESSLSYRQTFGYKDRTVSLKGEAFFEINKNTGKKFVVCTEYLNAEVLGTSFNFYAHEDEEVVELTLVSGNVKVKTNTAPVKEIHVKPNEKIIYHKVLGSLTLEKANTRFDTAWMRGELIFRSERMENVLDKIERKYGVKILVEEGSFKSDKFTGHFSGNNIRDVMEVLKTHYGFKYQITEENVLIYSSK